VSADGSLSNAIPIGNYLTLTGPVGGLVRFVGSSPHPILQTIRIQLGQFGSSTIVRNLRGVRFTFDDTKGDEIFIGNIRLSNVSSVDTGGFVASPVLASDDSQIDDGPAKTDVNEVKSIRSANINQIEIGLASNRDFLPQGELLVLRIGAREFTASHYPQTGETGSVTFTLSAEEFAQLEEGAPISVRYGEGHDNAAWRFGRLNKGQLAK
jgi:hypothetical protein